MTKEIHTNIINFVTSQGVCVGWGVGLDFFDYVYQYTVQ